MQRRELLRASDAELLRGCDVDRYRASGPGGQKRNKTESAVRVRHRDTGLSAHAVESRSQHENRERAVRRLRARFALELRELAALDAIEDAETLALVVKARAGERTRRTPDYLEAVARILDLLVAAELAVGEVARAIGVSTGALSKFLVADDSLARKVNELRAQAGMRPLRG